MMINYIDQNLHIQGKVSTAHGVINTAHFIIPCRYSCTLNFITEEKR